MRSHSKVAALVLAGFMAVVLASAAMADMGFSVVHDNSCPPPNQRVTVFGATIVTNGVPSPLLFWSRSKCLTGVPAQDTCLLAVLACDATCGNRILMSGGYIPKNFYGPGTKEEFRGPFCFVANNAWGGPGGLSTSDLPDTLSASFGLYSGGGFPNLNVGSSAGNDSVMSTYITRDAGTGTVLLEISKGGMQTSALTGSQQSFSELRLMVYPSAVVAANDASNQGIGAVYFAKATLIGPQGKLYTERGTSASDWIVTQNGGKWTARPKPGLSKLVSVSNVDSAVVRVIGDARSATSVPGQSPLILALIAIALLAGGAWVIRSRRNPLAA
jgi:hypothetical protein